METLGINWLGLLLQFAGCLAIALVLVMVSFVIRVKKPSRFLVGFIGFLTVLITVLFAVFVLAWIVMFVLNIANPSAGFETAFSFYTSNPVRVLGTIAILGIIVLWAYYISHVAKSPFIPAGDRVYYQIAFLILPFIMMPMYYLKYIKNEPSTVQKA